MDRRALRGAYARLRAIQSLVLGIPAAYVTESIGRDYDQIVENIKELTGEDTSAYTLPPRAYDSYEVFVGKGERRMRVLKQELQNKLGQMTSYLEYVYHVNENIIEIGSIYNSIKDDELKSRCSDLLSAPGNFDRVINQATQVLENRLRSVTKDEEGLTGTSLVNKYVKADPTRSVVELSPDSGEQEGYANLLRGMMGAFRNPSHHKFLEHIDREHALQICAFIDNLLLVLQDAKVDLSRK